MTEAAPPEKKEWIPRHSIVGRVWYPLLEERRTLAGAMCWIGIVLILLFLFIAALAPFLAPFDPLLYVDEKNVPPWQNAPIARNESFQAAVGNWSNPYQALEVDGVGTASAQVNDTETVTNFPLSVLRDDVVAAGLEVWLLPRGTDPGQYLEVSVSVNGGATWIATDSVRTVGSLVSIDLTSLRAWSSADLGPQNFAVRLRHAADAGTSGNLTVDYVGATTTWLSYWHLMGTDYVGRDVFSRVLYGTRTSLTIMAIGVFIALIVGFPLGLYSGYLGGNLDKVLVLVMDSLYSFPGLLFAGLIAVLLGKGVVNIGLAVTVIYIPLYFRVTRSQVLSAREELYVEAAKAIGARPSRIVFRYIAANVIVAIPVIFSISAADAILTAAGLSYLGLGIQAPTPDWGLDLSAAANLIDNGIWWSSFFPGLVIVLLTVGLSFLGEGLNDLINPLLKKER